MTWSSYRHDLGDRAISTVLDAAIFLLLVSAAIGLLYTVPQSGDDATADPDVAAETTTTLATSIATIEYVPAPDGEGDASASNRSDRGTIAELLAETTVANAEFRGAAFTRAPNHEAAVRNVTRRTIRQIDGEVEVQVRTRWRPLDGSGLRGGIVVGPSPPADADVHAATMRVLVGTATSSGPVAPNWSLPDQYLVPASTANESRSVPLAGHRRSLAPVGVRGCKQLGRVVASRALGTAFPPERTGIAMRVPGPQAATLDARYATAARSLDVSPEAFAPAMSTRERNALLATPLARQMTAACMGYDSAAAAGRRARPGAVLVSVRTWSP